MNVGGRSGSNRLAHRVSWTLYRGEIPDGLCVLHKCDTPPCVNPEHLFIGTLQDNNADMAAKGRWSINGPRGLKGESHPQAKLTVQSVREIRASTETSTILARRYGVSLTTLCNAREGKTWRHL